MSNQLTTKKVCSRKHSYHNKKTAERARERRNNNSKQSLYFARSYQCNVCDLWHLTTQNHEVKEQSMKCDICGADPITANCNGANCDTGKPDPVSDMFEEMGIKVVDVTPKTESAMTIDEAINRFRDYVQGKGDFDELDLKEVIVDNREEAVRERLPHIQEFYEWCTEEGIDEETMYKVAGWLGSEIYMPNAVAQLQSNKEKQ